MGSKSHFWFSFAKSVIRILGCGFAIRANSLPVLCVAFASAEILGMGEELVDRR